MFRNRIFSLFLAFTLFFPLLATDVSAQTTRPDCITDAGNAAEVEVASRTYKLLEALPFIGGECDSPTFPEYVAGIFKLAIYIVGIAALVMITIGGFWYVTSAGNATRVSTAKSIITDAFLGLFVAIFAWLLLNTINPNLNRYAFTAIPGTDNLGRQFCYTDENIILTDRQYCYTTLEACNVGRDSRSDLGETACINTLAPSESRVVQYCTENEQCYRTQTTCTTQNNGQECVGVNAEGNVVSETSSSTPPSYEESDCPTCIAAEGLNIKDPQGESGPLLNKACQGTVCKVDKDFLPDLQGFVGFLSDPRQAIGTATVTEAWPPTVSHVQSCHSNGTCVDVSLDRLTNRSMTMAFEEAERLGLYIELEFNPDTPGFDIERDRAGVPERFRSQIISVQGINGTHFSVYKDRSTKK